MKLTAVKIAELTNTSKANISKLTKNGKLIRSNDKYYNIDDSVNLDYLLSKGVTKEKILALSVNNKDNTEKSSSGLNKKPNIVKKEIKVLPDKKPILEPENQEMSFDEFDNITGLPERMMSLTLMELVSKYGGPMQLDKWAGILQKLMNAHKTEVSIERDRLTLIEKDFVISQVFKFIDEFINKIFDSVDAQNEIIFSLAKSGDDEAKIKIKKMRLDNYSKLSKDAKEIIVNNLKKMRDKYASDK